MNLYVGESNLIEWQRLQLGANRQYVPDATVTFAIKTVAGSTVTAGTGTLSRVTTSQDPALYQGYASASADITAGTNYVVWITATGSVGGTTLTGLRKITVTAAYHGATP